MHTNWKLKHQVPSLIALLALLASPVQAGPFCDWLCGRKEQQPAYPVGPPVPVGTGYSAGYAVYPQQAYAQQAVPATTPQYTAQSYTPAPATGYSSNYGAYYGPQLPVVGAGGAGYSTPPPSGISATTFPTT